MKITLMTHVQMMSIPAVMSRKDVFIKSQTGSGWQISSLIEFFFIRNVRQYPYLAVCVTECLSVISSMSFCIKTFGQIFIGIYIFVVTSP